MAGSIQRGLNARLKIRWKALLVVLCTVGCAQVPDNHHGDTFSKKLPLKLEDEGSRVGESDPLGAKDEPIEPENPLGSVTAPLYAEVELHLVADVPLVDCLNGGCQTESRPVFSNLSEAERRARIEAHASKDHRERAKRLAEDHEMILRHTEKALQRINERAALARDGEFMQIFVHLEDEDFDFERLRKARAQSAVDGRASSQQQASEARLRFNAIVAERRSQLLTKNKKVSERIESIGGVVTARRTSANILEVAIAPSLAARLLTQPEVLGIES